ncbi:MAG: chromosome segregation protein SMC, partial [Pseudomonadota bacterium]
AAAEAANTELERARSAHEAAAAPVDAMRADVRALEAEIAGLDRLLRKADGPARPAIMDEIRADKDIARALAAALGDDLDAPTDIAAPEHWTTRSRDANAKLPAGAQSLSDMVEAPAALLPRLKQCGLIDREDGARLQPALSQGQRLVSREGDLWRWDGFVRTAEAPTPAAEKLEQRARREACAASLSTARSDLARLGETADTAKAAFEAAKASASTTTSAAPEAARAAAKARESLLRSEQAVERLTLKTQSVTETIARLGSDRQTAEAAVTGARKALTSGPDDADKAAVDTARTEVQSAREAERAAHNVHSDLVRDQDRAVSRRRALEREQADWAARAEAATARLDALAAQRTSARAQLDAAEAAPEALEARAEALAKTVAEAEQARQLAADTLASAETTLREAKSAARQARDTNSAAREALARAEAREEAAMRRETEIEDNARAAFDRDLEALETLARAALHADEEIAEIEVSDDLHAQETRLALLKREREALGGVNLEADEQLSETSARLELQLSERNDLTGAIVKLREGVEALNKEGRARLLEAFEGVAAHFRSLFEALFEGGEAELRLTDSEDPLQAGLEIFACPPGKRLSTLSLMSGGEQALTAAALIFAVFLSRPAPLCVLDEVDAPL